MINVDIGEKNLPALLEGTLINKSGILVLPLFNKTHSPRATNLMYRDFKVAFASMVYEVAYNTYLFTNKHPEVEYLFVLIDKQKALSSPETVKILLEKKNTPVYNTHQGYLIGYLIPEPFVTDIKEMIDLKRMRVSGDYMERIHMKHHDQFVEAKKDQIGLIIRDFGLPYKVFKNDVALRKLLADHFKVDIRWVTQLMSNFDIEKETIQI